MTSLFCLSGIYRDISSLFARFHLSKYISVLLSHLVAGKLFCCTQPLYEQLINLSSFFILYENNLRKTCLNSFYSFYIELVPFLNDKFRAVELLLLLCRGTIVKREEWQCHPSYDLSYDTQAMYYNVLYFLQCIPEANASSAVQNICRHELQKFY